MMMMMQIVPGSGSPTKIVRVSTDCFPWLKGRVVHASKDGRRVAQNAFIWGEEAMPLLHESDAHVKHLEGHMPGATICLTFEWTCVNQQGCRAASSLSPSCSRVLVQAECDKTKEE